MNKVDQSLPSGQSAEIERYFDRLWPLLRSITGEGVRQTLRILSELGPIHVIEIPSGTDVFDWKVPKEWVCREAYVVTPYGHRILDVAENNLHLVNYSVPFRGTLPRHELDAHLHSIPDQPDAIPYVTSYYQANWGFCLTHRDRLALPEGDYQVVIDTEHVQGSLTIGEAILRGDEEEEILISTYTCHPSLANNELSGPLAAAFLMNRIQALPRRRLTYRFVFTPETVGSMAYLALKGDELRERTVAGFQVTCCGDPGPFTYKRSRRGNTLADRIAEHVLAERVPHRHRIIPFAPDMASDERIYCSPAFNLPVGSLMRTMYATYPEYHTSLDNKSFISMEALSESVDIYMAMVMALEQNTTYVTRFPEGEPQLSKRGLYHTTSAKDAYEKTRALFWILHYSDGRTDLLEIARQSGLGLAALHDVAERLRAGGVIDRVSVRDRPFTVAPDRKT